MKSHFNALRNKGCTVAQVNKSIKAAKAIFTYAFDSEYVTSNVMHRFPTLQRAEGERTANRGVFTEAELQGIFVRATAFELVLREHRVSSGEVGLVFPSAAGTPLNNSNVRKRMWMPLLERAEIRYRDIYSLRWTFVSLGARER